MGTQTFYNPDSYPLHALENELILSSIIDNNGDINQSVRISGKQIKEFKNLKRIKGNLYLQDASIKSLGSLKEIWGDLSI